MQIVIEGEAAAVVERLVRTGQFASAQEVVEQGLRLADAEAAKLAWMRRAIQDAEDEGGDGTMEDLDRELEAVFQELEKEFPDCAD